jgi:hypothetical protein
MSQTTHLKEIIKPEASENIKKSLQLAIAELVSMYETVKPLIHSNVTYDLRYYNRKQLLNNNYYKCGSNN